MNVVLKEEQAQLRETFLASLKEEQARLVETNVALKEEQDKLKEMFLGNLRDEESRLKEMNDALRDEQQVLKDTYLANLREEESLLKEVNANLREEQAGLRETFLANFVEEEQRLRAANDALRQEKEEIKASLKEEQERFKIELLANLMEEESRLKDGNALLREEQELLRADFLARLKEDEARITETLTSLRSEQDNLTRQKTRLTADLSSLDTALRLRREELHEMEARAESLERRILEGVMDHSRVLLMAKTNRAAASSGRDSMSRKRVPSSSATKSADVATPKNGAGKPRSAITMAMSARSKATTTNTPNGTPTSANRRILSLSQITNNVPAGGIKRSQSVRTAGGAAAARGLRKSSWAPPPVPAIPSAAAAAKGYGDLEMGGEDKENAGMDLREGDEDAYNAREMSPEPEPEPPVEIVISEAGAGEEGVHEDEEGDLDRFSDLGEGDHDEEEDARSLRRSSHGTTVITPVEGGEDEHHEGEEVWSEREGEEEEESEGDDDDVDDAASDWTESVVGRESDVGLGRDEREASVPVAAAS
jgi:hypothetical protein